LLWAIRKLECGMPNMPSGMKSPQLLSSLSFD
jgi:hypothetical protein